MARRSLRRVALSALQWLFALGALVWLLSGLDLAAAWRLLGRLDPAVIAALLVVTAVGLLGRFYTWQVLTQPVTSAPLRSAARTDLTVNFVNQLLPSRVSGRVAAPFVLRGETGMDLPDATAVAALHTAMFAVWYGLVAVVGLAVVAPRLSPGLALLLALSTGLYLLAGAVVLLGGANLTVFDRLASALRGILARLPVVGEPLSARVGAPVGFGAAATDRFRSLAARPGLWARYGLGWGVKHLLAAGARVWLLLGAFGAGPDPVVLVALYLVVAYSVTLLPLTPGGIGITEATATVVFVALGVPAAAAASAILLDRLLGVYLPALAGWYPSLSVRWRAPGEA